MEVTCSSELSANFKQMTQHYSPEAGTLKILRFHILSCYCALPMQASQFKFIKIKPLAIKATQWHFQIFQFTITQKSQFAGPCLKPLLLNVVKIHVSPAMTYSPSILTSFVLQWVIKLT
jgi:hypothetical protein